MKFFKLVHMFKIKHGLAPQYLRFDLSSVSDTHTHNTHGSTSNFHVSKSLSQMPSSFAFSSVKYWNSLPAGLKGINSLSTFKRELRRFFLSSYGWLSVNDLSLSPTWISNWTISSTYLQLHDCVSHSNVKEPVGNQSSDFYRLSLIRALTISIVYCFHESK